MGLYYDEYTQRQYLNDAGIKEGFFSVQIGNKKQEYYYSNGLAGVAVPKWQYDADYDMLVKRGSALFNEYEPGSIFKMGGKEYTLSANRTFDIPYGTDPFEINDHAKERHGGISASFIHTKRAFPFS